MTASEGPRACVDACPCPQLGCLLQARVLEWFVLESTDGPIEHLCISCDDHHRFTMPAETIARYRGSAASP